MPEPTIDEMLAYFSYVAGEPKQATSQHDVDCHNGIRAILEQRREWDEIDVITGHTLIDPKKALADIRLLAIRAFVERAEARLYTYSTGSGAGGWLQAYHRAIKEELAAMEKEQVA